MTFRRITPYFLIVTIFALTYWVTMIIPNRTLFFGYWLDTSEVINNNKIPLHLYIFNYGLTLIILAVNLLEILSTKQDKFWLRLFKSILTILLVYFISHYIFKTLDTSIWNMHYYPRGAPANIWCIVTIFMTTVGLVIIEGLKKLYFEKFDKSTIGRFIPKWLRLERAC